jgi:hypothetical protein
MQTPSMNSEFVTIAPAMDALTRSNMPARRAVIAITSSVRFPSVALSSPPTASPVFAPRLRVGQQGRRNDARTDSTNSAGVHRSQSFRREHSRNATSSQRMRFSVNSRLIAFMREP